MQEGRRIEGVGIIKKETPLTFYGGVNEIGGNNILLKDGDTKIFFDFGMSFSMRRLFCFSPFPSRRPRNICKSLESSKLDGIYKFDSKLPEIDAVFVSHDHLDHSAYLFFINRQIPVYCGETTHTILRALNET